jgi:uncharacterized OsmC-like protein
MTPPRTDRSAPVSRARRSQVAARQAPLRDAYRLHPERALIIDRGRTTGHDGDDPLHTRAIPGEEYAADEVEFGVGTHRGVGGMHDAPNPGELLCATLAACQDSTIRMIANLLGVQITSLVVEVSGQVDLRGTLTVDTSVPVGFRSMRCQTHLGVVDDTDKRTIQLLLTAAERSCVVLDTLRKGVQVESEFNTST